MKNNLSSKEIVWNLWCTLSLVGIWPRFIEPKWIRTTQLSLKIQQLPPELSGLKVLQFSDLHMHNEVSDKFLKRLSMKIMLLKPDLIVFTGDILCYSKLIDSERLKKFLDSLYAPYGCFAIYGNHDYAECVSINESGDYDLLDESVSSITQGFKRLFSKIKLSKNTTARAKAIKENPELVTLLKQTCFTLLNNTSQLLSIKGSKLNICGLGEYVLGRCLPDIAFANYDQKYPGIILAHNPDSISILKDYPGDIVLSGHTHGGQINLPGVWSKLTLLENQSLKKGLFKFNRIWLYVNRGIGSTLSFRWFSPPELLLLTLESNVNSKEK